MRLSLLIFFTSPIVGNGRTLSTWAFIRSQVDPHNQMIWSADGATYHTSWMAAISSNPDWITITTFNESFEGAMIEPSVHYGSLYLDLTAQYAKLWHG